MPYKTHLLGHTYLIVDTPSFSQSSEMVALLFLSHTITGQNLENP
jgi:hypothetical protein